MTVDEAIKRLKDLREVVGGDASFCISDGTYRDGKINAYRRAAIETVNVVHVDYGNENSEHWVCLMNGNTDRIVAAY